ncbi:hypothetical protein BGZ65_006692 [Modicella reniformis]|uniref:Uncharacterized protein n=1 Tax=Modicella reniformis TaxID=1440133 RepID=A0A9P6MLJ4_9FUNG|nr:hypothetical protein BGZ65_006692 [Modicella reniformis]
MVATSDSDFLFHGVDVVLRQDPRQRSKYRAINIQHDILDKLEISPAAWTVAGVISRNDYTNNVPGCGLQTNVDIMKTVDMELAREDLLLEYCETISVERGLTEVCQTSQFDMSKDIFFDHRESMMEVPLSTNTALDSDMKAMLQDLQMFLRQCVDVRKQKSASASAVSASSSPSTSSSTTQVSDRTGFHVYCSIFYVDCSGFYISCYLTPRISEVNQISHHEAEEV